MKRMQVPFFRPDLREEEVDEVVATLRSGWLTTGPRVRRFEQEFAAAVGARHAIAVSSCTAALHLAVEALKLKPGDAVLVPTMTFASTAEVVRYHGAIPILVDCDPITSNMDLDDAARKVEELRSGSLLDGLSEHTPLVGIMPVHVGGMMMNIKEIKRFASDRDLWIVEDAAHAFPAAWKERPNESLQRCGEGTATLTCFSFYANKTITTGEGGMIVTDNASLAERVRLMSLHGLSHDAWGRYSGNGNWDYSIIAPGYKYNLTDIAAAIGIHQLARAEEMRRSRESIALRYLQELSDVDEIELPPNPSNRIHAWHLFAIKLRLEKLTTSRNDFVEELRSRGIGFSVHWRPLHLHPYYQQEFGWQPEDCPAATSVWQRIISLPIFSGMTKDDVNHVVRTVKALCQLLSRKVSRRIA
jgi:dTDP-4-amino-4,6-dideoxygalactose transaminase